MQLGVGTGGGGWVYPGYPPLWKVTKIVTLSMNQVIWCKVYSNFQGLASIWAMCLTTTLLPCFSRPPWICIRQPGQAVTTISAWVSIMSFNFRSIIASEMPGYLSE